MALIHWHECTAKVIRSSRGHWPAGSFLGPKWFRQRVRDFNLWYVFAGSGWLAMSDRSFRLKAGCLVCLKAGRSYEARQDDEARLGIANIHFRLQAPNGNRLSPEEVDLPDLHLSDEPSQIIDSGFHRIASLYRTSLADETLSAECMNLASEQLRYLLMELRFRSLYAVPDKSKSVHERHYRLIDRFISLAQDSDGRHRPIADIAREMGYTPEHFIRLIKQETGLTPKAIILQMRIQEAKDLLNETSLNISEISEHLGYHDVFSFSQQFKQKTGYSPSRFRREAEESP